MKKSKSAPRIDYFLLTILFVLGLATAFLLSSYNVNPLEQKYRNQSASYGNMGYGRGMVNYNKTSYVNTNKETCLMDGCLLVEDAEFPVAELNEQTIKHLQTGLADERKALATYETVMDKLGKVRPFINIARAEEHHISMLKALFDKYGVEIPPDTTQLRNIPETMTEACQLAAGAEIANDALYQKMIPEVDNQDIKDVFSALADSSKLMHLPAFVRCSN
jgi:hypothetical protein